MPVEKQEYHRASNAVVFGGLVTYIAGLLLVMAFTSPYWIESYQETFSSFKHMGLWEYCFKEFRYPYYQFDKQFDGCHHIFSEEYYVIREWLLPVWLLVVQTFVTVALLLSFAAQVMIALTLVRWPLRFVLNNEWILSASAFLCCAGAGTLLFLAVSIFGGQCWRRDWLMYPNFNHLSWSYALAVVSFMFHWLAAFFLYLDATSGHSMRRQSRNLVMQMQPNPQTHQGLQRGGYI
ncbi:claudin superfamily protein pickel [Lasioglossum baleicum]|uniref:claudin superfamily protein pickel n=1 Tax=Lasioglossum baleicum TaxID=434251 RepID=UPI003FCCE7C4